jgi:FAD dependent oxidoreductase
MGPAPASPAIPELLKVQLDELVTGAGARVFFHSIVAGVEPEADGWRLRITTPTTGTWEVRAHYLIDASGDATAAALAGAPVLNAHRDGGAQALTTIFFLAGVDVERAMAVSHQDRTAMIAQADASGTYRLPRHEGSLHRTPHPGVLQANIVRIAGIDATDPAALTAAEIEGRRQAYEYLRFFRDRLPGCDEAFIVSLGHQIGIRETRRIVGRTILTEEDVLAGRRGEDGIALCGAPIEDHRAGSDTRWASVGGDGVYSIPYGSLLPRHLGDRMIVAGRCLSADHAAQASARNSAPAFATGEAAGYAVAAAADAGGSPADVDVTALRTRIVDAGGLL